jgi:hypothetical protein
VDVKDSEIERVGSTMSLRKRGDRGDLYVKIHVVKLQDGHDYVVALAGHSYAGAAITHAAECRKCTT